MSDEFGWDDLILFPDDKKAEVKMHDTKKKIGDKFIGELTYSWEEAEKAGVSLELIAYLAWGATIFVGKAKGIVVLPLIHYNVLLRAAKKYPKDDLKKMMTTIKGAKGYGSVVYNGKIDSR